MKLTSLHAVALLLALSMVLSTGCGPKAEEAPWVKQMRELENRLSALQADHDRLAAELANLKTRPVTSPVSDLSPLKAELTEEVAARLSSNISEVVQKALNERIGSDNEINAVFEDVLNQTMQAAEAKRQQERQAQQEQWRKSMEERRQQAEEHRMQQMTEDLQLTTGQQEAMAEISKEIRTQAQTMIQSMWTGGAEGIADIPAAIQKLRTENEARARTVLTEDQFTTYTNGPYNTFGALSRMVNTFTGDQGRGRRSSQPAKAPTTSPVLP